MTLKGMASKDELRDAESEGMILRDRQDIKNSANRCSIRVSVKEVDGRIRVARVL